MENTNNNWFKELFIDQAKPALNRRSGGGVSSWNDLTDRPFGSKITEQLIFPETTIDGFFESGGCWVTSDISPSPFDLVEGNLYHVNYNGTVYECVAKSPQITTFATFPDIQLYLGNQEYFGGDYTNEPFGVVYSAYSDGQSQSSVAIAQENGNPCRISISEVVEVVTKLDEKYLPYGESVQKIVFDGNTDGKEMINMNGAFAVKVSDTPVSKESLIGAEFTLVRLAGDGSAQTFTITEEMVMAMGGGLVIGEGFIISIIEDGTEFIGGMVLNRGLYFVFVPDNFYASELVCKQVKKIPAAWLPETGVTKFYEVAEDAGRLHMSIDTSVETRVHSKDIDAAIARGTIVIYAVYESGSLDYILYPAYIRLGVSGYSIGAYMGHDLLEFKTSDFEDSEAGPS